MGKRYLDIWVVGFSLGVPDHLGEVTCESITLRLLYRNDDISDASKTVTVPGLTGHISVKDGVHPFHFVLSVKGSSRGSLLNALGDLIGNGLTTPDAVKITAAIEAHLLKIFISTWPHSRCKL